MEGDFLYLDADTVPVGRFDEIFTSKAPLSAAIDRNRASPCGGFPAWAEPDFDALGWARPTKMALNDD